MTDKGFFFINKRITFLGSVLECGYAIVFLLNLFIFAKSVHLVSLFPVFTVNDHHLFCSVIHFTVKITHEIFQCFIRLMLMLQSVSQY